MCGIAGFIGSENIENHHDAILRTMSRRGPDDRGIYKNNEATLFHSRLTVVDPEHGRQPMSYIFNRNKYTVVYNGELYNTEDIRKKLIKAGESFTGHGDTEVLLKAYAHWGEKSLGLFNGIFAFALWDENEHKLFLARDRMGVKPLFYYCENERFIFASEIKTLLEFPGVESVIDLNSVCEIMLLGPGRTGGQGVFRGIKELKPGECAFYREGNFKIKSYWRLNDKFRDESFEDTAAQVGFLVTDAIERQLVSDVPIGTFLSGGLDSSIISSVASRYLRRKGERLKTFSISYKDNDKYFQKSKFQPNSDDDFIKIMVDYLGSEHHYIIVDTDMLVSALYKAVEARDLPGMADIDSSLLLFCGEVKKHVTVALSGECADEIFGGYPWYRDETIRSAYGFPWAQSTAYRAGFLTDKIIKSVDAQSFVNEKYNASLKEVSKIPDIDSLESRMREMIHLNIYWFMQTLLDRKDRMSMYNSLEVRVPFCDHRIAEYLYSTPWAMKEYNGFEKGLLRSAMKDFLPDGILRRKKSPYPKTHNPDYLNAVSRILSEIIENKNAPLFEIANINAVKKLLTQQTQQPWYGQLMTTPQTIAYLIQLNYWLEKYHVKISL